MPLVALAKGKIDEPVSKLTEFLRKLVYMPTHQVERIRPFRQNGDVYSAFNHCHADAHLSQFFRVQMQINRSVWGTRHHIGNLLCNMTWQIETRHGSVRARYCACSVDG